MLLWDMIDPRGSFRAYWDLLIMLSLLYVALVIPFTVSFDVDINLHTVIGWFELVVDIVFILDVYLNFRTGVISKCCRAAFPYGPLGTAAGAWNDTHSLHALALWMPLPACE
jgi:hypothetical protein